MTASLREQYVGLCQENFEPMGTTIAKEQYLDMLHNIRLLDGETPKEGDNLLLVYDLNNPRALQFATTVNYTDKITPWDISQFSCNVYCRPDLLIVENLRTVTASMVNDWATIMSVFNKANALFNEITHVVDKYAISHDDKRDELTIAKWLTREEYLCFIAYNIHVGDNMYKFKIPFIGVNDVINLYCKVNNLIFSIHYDLFGEYDIACFPGNTVNLIGLKPTSEQLECYLDLIAELTCNPAVDLIEYLSTHPET